METKMTAIQAGQIGEVPVDNMAQTIAPPTMDEVVNKPLSKRQMLLKMIGAASMIAVPLHTRLAFGLGCIPGDKYYLGLPMKRVKGKWRVKH